MMMRAAVLRPRLSFFVYDGPLGNKLNQVLRLSESVVAGQLDYLSNVIGCLCNPRECLSWDSPRIGWQQE